MEVVVVVVVVLGCFDEMKPFKFVNQPTSHRLLIYYFQSQKISNANNGDHILLFKRKD